MLSPVDASLVARDPALPGLPVLLDSVAVSELVGASVTRRYLRYKPGTSCVLGATAEVAGGQTDIFITAYEEQDAVKLAKILAGAAAGQVLATDLERGLVAARAAADRDLPALAVLADERRRPTLLRRLLPEPGGRRKSTLSTLSYKPMRRWVGVLDRPGRPPVVLRAYRPNDAATAAAVLRQLPGGPPDTPRLVGSDLRLGVLAVEFVPGRPLEPTLQEAAAGAGQLSSAGRALAQLHCRRLGGSPRTGADDAEAVRAAAEQVAVLLPDAGSDARRLAASIAARLAVRPPASCAIHGDFSLDQVVLQPSGAVALLDLDSAAEGDPAADLGSLAAAVVTDDVLSGRPPTATAVLQQVCEGYAGVRPLPSPEAVQLHTAAFLLRRAAEPFRLCVENWPTHTRALLDAAAGYLGAASAETGHGSQDEPVQDLLADVLGVPVRLEVLKDKPGRRRTSRAHGPRGTAIVKTYASARAATVAARLVALADGPPEPVLPRLLVLDEPGRRVVLSEVAGSPLRDAALGGRLPDCHRAGAALGRWHRAWWGVEPAPLRPHPVERELEILRERAARAPGPIRALVDASVDALSSPWVCATVVHRDLYEDQLLVGERIGLIDLDDAALGPAELDVGNLLAHLERLSLCTGENLTEVMDTLLAGYATAGPVLDPGLTARCRSLTLLRLACIHRDERLARLATPRNPAVSLPRAR